MIQNRTRTLSDPKYYIFINCSLEGSNYVLELPLDNCCFQIVRDASATIRGKTSLAATGCHFKQTYCVPVTEPGVN